jgi:hypothetical protein
MYNNKAHCKGDCVNYSGCVPPFWQVFSRSFDGLQECKVYKRGQYLGSSLGTQPAALYCGASTLIPRQFAI